MYLALIASSCVRILLAGVFGLAAVSKILDRHGVTHAIEGFGMPRWSARPLAVLLPLSEACLVLLLTLDNLYRLGAALAATLLTLFNLAIALNLMRGRRPECNCFGQVHSSPIGAATLLRNLALTGLALAVFFGVPTSPASSLQAPSLSLWSTSSNNSIGVSMALTFIVLFGLLIWLVVRLFREHGRLLIRLEAQERQLAALGASNPQELIQPPAIAAPSFALPNLSGETISLSALLEGGRSAVLIFSNPNCQSCNELVPAIVYWQRQYAEILNFAILTEGSHEANQKKFTTHRFDHVLLQDRREVADLYGATLTPTAVWIDPSGKLSSTLHAGAQAVAELVAHVTGDAALAPVRTHTGRSSAPPRLPDTSQARPAAVSVGPGHLAPAFRLADIHGVEVSPLEVRGIYTLLVFWNPNCRFCNDMLPELKNLDSSLSSEFTRMVVLSAGSTQQIRELDLRSTVLPDPGFVIGKTFGVQGTPSAVLLDGETRIVSPIAVGAQAIARLVESQLSHAAR